MDEMIPYLRAIVALQVATLAETQPGLKPEPLLDRAGLDIKAISDLVGKSYPAVAKTLSRDRAKGKRPSTQPD